MQFIHHFIKGAVIGIANIIPGVSGGTMALIMGIYDQLTEAIGNFLTIKDKRKEYFKFLLVVFLGALVGILLFAKLLTWLLANPVSKQYTYFFVVGLIIGSIPFILKRHQDMRPLPSRLVFLMLGLVLIIGIELIGGVEHTTKQHEVIGTIFGVLKITPLDMRYYSWLLFCGFVSSTAMILPGISGSALLVSLGEYGNILYMIDERLVVPLAFFGIGILIGIIICAKIVSALLKKYTANTYYFIIGLMLASVIQIFHGLKEEWILSGISLLISVILLVIGGMVSYYFSQLEKE